MEKPREKRVVGKLEFPRVAPGCFEVLPRYR